MPVYDCQIISAAGEQYSQKLDAPTVAALRAQIEGRKDFLIGHREVKDFGRAHRTRLKPKTLVQLYDLLAMLMDAGVLTQTAVERLKDDFPDRKARKVLNAIHANLVVARESLSGAMAQFPSTFPESVIGTVKVGERNGVQGLADRLRDLRDQVQFRIEVRKTVIRATSYPALVLTFAGGVVTFAMLRVIPQFVDLLGNLNAPLPRTTLVLIAIAQAFRAWALPAIVAVVLGFGVLGAMRRLGSVSLDRLLLRIPYLGSVLRALVTADVAKHYRALYAAGVQAGPTLEACADAVGNRAVRRALMRARTLLESGILTKHSPNALAITEALRSTGYFPELALLIVSTGENAGKLGAALESVATHYAREAAERIDVFFAVFNKILFLLVIAVVGWVAVSIYLPIVGAAQTLK